MELHNMCEITVGNNTYISYNSMFSTFSSILDQGLNYTQYFALGTGTSATTSDMSTLENCVAVCPSEYVNYVCDSKRKCFYLIKKCEFGGEDDRYLEFSEVGVTPYGNSTNPVVVNRFLVNGGNPIIREPGEKMTITVRIILVFNSFCLPYELVDGDNIMARWLLGIDEIKTRTFSIAKGNTGNINSSERFNWTPEILETYPTGVETGVDEDGKLFINLTASVGTGFNELLLLMNGQVVLRQARDSMRKATGDFITEQKMTEGLGWYSTRVFKPARLTNIYQIKHAKPVTQCMSFKVASSWVAAAEEFPYLEGVDFSQGAYSSRNDGNRLALKNGNGMRVYEITNIGNDWAELDATNIDTTDLTHAYVIDNHIYVRYQNTETNSCGIRHYAETGGVYYEKPFNFEHNEDLPVNPEDIWVGCDMDTTMRSGDDRFYHYLVILVSNRLVMYRIKYNDDGSVETAGFNDYGKITGTDVTACRSYNNEMRIVIRQCPLANNKAYMICNDYKWTCREEGAFLGTERDYPGLPKIRNDILYTRNSSVKRVTLVYYPGNTTYYSPPVSGGTHWGWISHNHDYIMYYTGAGGVGFRTTLSTGMGEILTPGFTRYSQTETYDYFDVWGEYAYLCVGNHKVYKRKLRKERDVWFPYSDNYYPYVKITYCKGEAIGDGELTVKIKLSLLGFGDY